VKKNSQLAIVALFMLTSSLLVAQPQAVNTLNRIHLRTDPVNDNPENWSNWRSAEAEEFTWTPPGAFWRGFIKTSSGGSKAGIFVALYTPRGNFGLESFDQTAIDGFAEDGAGMVGRTSLTVSGYAADNLIFSSSSGDGLYFTGRRTPTTVSVVHVKLEKERGVRMYPFLVFYLATTSSNYDDVVPEFEKFVEATVIDPLYGSITGRVISKASGIGIAGVALQLLDSRTSTTTTRLAASDGGYRFDSLSAGNYYLTRAEVPGFKPQSQPVIIELGAGTDTMGVDFLMEEAAVPVAESKVKPKPKPKPRAEGEAPELVLGIGYRHRLNDIWGAGVNLRAGNLVPEFTLGLDFGGEGSDTTESSEGLFLASLGASYFFLHYDNAHLGAGAYGMVQFLGSKAALGLEIPLTAEYFIVPSLSVQASTGVVVSDLTDKARISIGPQSLLGSLGFTWYFR
jgi:hypothetical protein